MDQPTTGTSNTNATDETRSETTIPPTNTMEGSSPPSQSIQSQTQSVNKKSDGQQSQQQQQNQNQQQVTKLRDANTKYKNLLKMAKERIQAQEEELEQLKLQVAKKEEQLSNSNALLTLDNKINNSNPNLQQDAMNNNNNNNNIMDSSLSSPPSSSFESIYMSYEYDLPHHHNDHTNNNNMNNNCSVVRVHQRIQLPDFNINVRRDQHSHSSSKQQQQQQQQQMNSSTHDDDNQYKPEFTTGDDDDEEEDYGMVTKLCTWALVEYEITPPEYPLDSNTANTNISSSTSRFTRWRKFNTESQLLDHIRKDSGEPIYIPPYSLTPQQSQTIQEESKQAIAHITEEFRRFRVKAEVARKQSDATLKSLQNSNIYAAKKHIEGQDITSELAQARNDHLEVERLRSELMEMEDHWKVAYDTLLAENAVLKSSGSEALLAAQWRARYESCVRDKEDLETNLRMEKEKVDKIMNHKNVQDAGKYESKYKDLKESFKIYRKKAKEIFDAQQKGGNINGVSMMLENGTEEARISYLRNLMVNYLSSDPSVRDHMEKAIGTVLKFTQDDFDKISKHNKERNGSSEKWFF